MKEELRSLLLDFFSGCNTVIVEYTELDSGNYEVVIEDGVPIETYIFELEPCGKIVRQFSFV